MRLLLVAPIYAASLLTGGGQRTFHLCRALAQLGVVDLLLISEPSCDDLERGIERIRSDFVSAHSILVRHSTRQFLDAPSSDPSPFERCAYLGKRLCHVLRRRAHFYRPMPSALAALIRSIKTARYDVIVVRYLQCAASSGALDQGLVPVVVDLDDLDEVAIESRMKSPTTSPLRKTVLSYQAYQVRSIVRRLRGRAQHVFTASEADLALVEHPSSSVLPNIPVKPTAAYEESSLRSAASSNVVLFVGSYGHRANRDGLIHFAYHAWPAVRSRVAGARLRIVGSGGWELRRDELEAIDGVEVAGMVADIAEEYRAAAICVVPLFEGAGTKIKVLESLIYGRTVVASPHATHGYEQLVGHGILLGADDARLADHCVRLLKDSELRESLEAAGRAMVATNYSFAAFLSAVRNGINAVEGARDIPATKGRIDRVYRR